MKKTINQLATVRDWCKIPDETYAGINGVIDELNEIISSQQDGVVLVLGNITLYQEPPTKAVVHELLGILICENEHQAKAIGETLCNEFVAWLIPSVYSYPIEYECKSTLNCVSWKNN